MWWGHTAWRNVSVRAEETAEHHIFRQEGVLRVSKCDWTGTEELERENGVRLQRAMPTATRKAHLWKIL